MRIATNTLYQNSLDTMGNQQSSMVDLQNQIATGKRVATSADDPQAASQTVRLTQANAKLSQYAGNLTTAKSSLQLQDVSLSQITTLVQQAQTLVVNAGDTTLDKTSRDVMATQIESVRDQLLNQANTTDSQGSYLYGGFETGTPPFVANADGSATYQGSPGQREVQVTDARRIEIGGVGNKIFQSVSAGASRIVSTPLSNTGSAVFSPISTADSSDPHFGDVFSIAFNIGDDGATRYTVHDASTNTDIAQNQPYTAGTAIKFAGQSLTVSGTPANGDKIAINDAQSGGMDIFATLTTVANALRTSVQGSEGNAKMGNVLTTASLKLNNALDNVLNVQAGVGAREQEANTLSTQNSDTGVQYQTQLSDLTGADFVSVYSQFSQVQTSLQAAEKTFMQIQNLSLFDLIK